MKTSVSALSNVALSTQGAQDRHQASGYKSRNLIKFGTWNVHSLSQKGKLENIKLEMHDLKIQILGISEIRWTDKGNLKSGDFNMYYSCGMHHEKGIGILLHKEITKSVIGFWPVLDRVIMVKIHAKPFNINIIQVYAPTSSSSEEDLEEFYSGIDSCIKQCKSNEIKVVLGDFNAKVRKGRHADIVGNDGIGSRNNRGDKLIDWCEQNDQVNLITWFTKHPRCLWTWKSPDSTTKNQIDYITINSRFRNCVKNLQTLPGADCNSDHVLLVSDIQVKLKCLKQRKVETKRNVAMLQDQETRTKYKEVKKTIGHPDKDANLETTFQKIKDAL